MAMSPRLLRPRASGGFDPRTIVGLQLWLDGNDASTITLNGSNVSQWNDKSGAGRNVSQGTSADQPEYVTGSLNGKAGLNWGSVGGTAKRLSSSAVSFTGRDYYIVADWDGGATFGGFESLLSASGNPLGGEASGSTIVRAFNEYDQIRINNNANSSTLLPTISNPFVMRATKTAAVAATPAAAIHVGSFLTFPTRGWAGKLYEILIYNSSLSASQSSAVQNYLSRKWGITLA